VVVPAVLFIAMHLIPHLTKMQKLGIATMAETMMSACFRSDPFQLVMIGTPQSM